MSVRLHEPSRPELLTLREAAEAAGCSVSLARKLVRSGEVPAHEEKTARGFRYVIDAEVLPVLAHKAAMRLTGRGEAVSGGVLPSRKEDSRTFTVRADEDGSQGERELLRAENARLWEQIARLTEQNTRLTEAVTRLALPPAREEPEPPAAPREEKRLSWWQRLWRGDALE